MTTGELLDSKSSVSNTTALTHLQNISGGGSVILYDKIEIIEDEDILLIDKTDNLLIFSEDAVAIEENDIIVKIVEKSEDEIDGIC